MAKKRSSGAGMASAVKPKINAPTKKAAPVAVKKTVSVAAKTKPAPAKPAPATKRPVGTQPNYTKNVIVKSEDNPNASRGVKVTVTGRGYQVPDTMTVKQMKSMKRDGLIR